MSLRILVLPDKFKGTLDASAVATAMAAGWKKSRPGDVLELMPMSDGGDGFGEVLSLSLRAKRQSISTVDAAHQPMKTLWWWEPKTKTAIIESAKVIGLAMVPQGRFHPFQLDTYGLGKVLLAAARKGARRCIIGIGGSATNDGGFGMARALGWRFFGDDGEIISWTALHALTEVHPPSKPLHFNELIVAVDVKNKLLGAEGCSRVYGPQKGLKPEDFPGAERCLRKLAQTMAKLVKAKVHTRPGAGAAGGLGFGLMAFAGATPRPGFEIFSEAAHLPQKLAKADIVLTGEGAIDRQTLMGKGVGELALLCRKKKVPVLALAGTVLEPKKANRFFTLARGLTEITTLEKAKQSPAKYLEELAAQMAREWEV